MELRFVRLRGEYDASACVCQVATKILVRVLKGLAVDESGDVVERNRDVGIRAAFSPPSIPDEFRSLKRGLCSLEPQPMREAVNLNGDVL